MGNGLLQEAMRALPIRELWKRRGWAGAPGKSCHFPNDADRKKAACSIFTATTGKHAGIELLKDHKRGMTWDAPGLLAEVEGLPIKEACRLFIGLAGVKSLDEYPQPRPKNRRKASAAPKVDAASTDKPPAPVPFDFKVLRPHDLDSDEIEAIATTRGVSVRTIEHIASFNCLHGVALTAWLRLPIPRQSLPMWAWALHAPDWRSFRLRPFCGKFPGFNNGQEHKSLTPAGGSCAWPVWVGHPSATRVLVVEGEGDCLGAWEIARRERAQEGLAVLVMFSSSLSVPSSFLPRLEGKRVRIVPHCGDSRRQGEVAAVKWAAALRPWAADVHVFSLVGLTMPDGRDVGDLGDLAQCPDGILSRCGGVARW